MHATIVIATGYVELMCGGAVARFRLLVLGASILTFQQIRMTRREPRPLRQKATGRLQPPRPDVSDPLPLKGAGAGGGAGRRPCGSSPV